MANMVITTILEKMTGKDKDYRYMATSDLLNELNKEGFKLDADLEAKVSNVVIQQLDDAAGDVSGLAVKCLYCSIFGEPLASIRMNLYKL
ncbi:unnamed protein product [Cuscuta campestris]|uniref:Uncharacterized protein n=1 Tax=Cuscuta campestris TaxID=132261 RepID=A0A484MQN5_9ASTE|nr:unnamed protein product [Cuscuta campestris]